MLDGHTLSAVIVAAGVGERFGSDKLLATIDDLPVLIHTVRAFLQPEIDELIIAAHPEKLSTYTDLIRQHLTDPRLRLITGGRERWQSSHLGIQATTGEYVAIHDAARPLIDPAVIMQSFATSLQSGAAVVAAPATDSVKVVHDGLNTQALDRTTIYLAQTPQTFQRELILRAYDAAFAAGFTAMTDESELVTRFLKQPVTVVPSTSRNLKITFPGDLEIVRALYHM